MPKKTKKTKRTTQKQKQSVNVKINIDNSRKTRQQNPQKSKGTRFQAPFNNSLPSPTMDQNFPQLPVVDNNLKENKEITNALILRSIQAPPYTETRNLIKDFTETTAFRDAIYDSLIKKFNAGKQQRPPVDASGFSKASDLTRTGLEASKTQGVNIDDKVDDEAPRLLEFTNGQEQTQNGLIASTSVGAGTGDENFEDEEETKRDTEPPKKKMTKAESLVIARRTKVEKMQGKLKPV